MTERATKTITTSSGIEVTVKTYINAREAHIVKEAIYSKMKVDVSGGEISTKSDLSGSFLIEQEKEILKLIVVSLAGSAENIIERLLDLPNGDYQEILKAVNEIYSGNLTPAK